MITQHKKLLRYIIVISAIGLWLPVPAESQLEKLPAKEKAGDAKFAREIAGRYLKLARTAIGGEEALGQVQSLRFSGKWSRIIKYAVVQSPTKVIEKERTLSSKLEVEFLLPDKFRKRVNIHPLRGFPYSFDLIVNGDRAWRNPPLRVIPFSSGDRRIVDVDDFDKTVALQALGARHELTFISLGWMLQALPSFPLEYSYQGRFQLASGDVNLINVRGPEEFLISLLLDQKTNMPMALAWSFEEVRRQAVIVEYAGFSRKIWMEIGQRVRQERLARTKPRQRYELLLKLSDHRPVGGVLWPYRLTTTVNNELTEDFMINNLEINRPINPKRFEGETEPKY